MELLKLHRRRSRLSDVAYTSLNIGLALAVLAVTWSTQSIWLPLLIVLIGKWRVFAVRPRFWRQNILANGVDSIVGMSHVVFLYAASGYTITQILLTFGYVFWLLFVKPRSKRLFVTAQASAALFVGVTALSMVAYEYNVALFVVGMWMIGYVTARHVLMHYEVPVVTFFSLVWALVVAELGWLGYWWMFAYTLPGSANLKFSQLALIVTLLGFVTERALASHHQHGTIRREDIIVPSVFAVSIIVLLLAFFSKLTAANGL